LKTIKANKADRHLNRNSLTEIDNLMNAEGASVVGGIRGDRKIHYLAQHRSK